MAKPQRVISLSRGMVLLLPRGWVRIRTVEGVEFAARRNRGLIEVRLDGASEAAVRSAVEESWEGHVHWFPSKGGVLIADTRTEEAIAPLGSACPGCYENFEAYLVVKDDDSILCHTCGHTYESRP